MADNETFSGIKILKNSKIVVNVEEALQDVLVVTYALENKLFQGVLLDSSKRILPCGITPPPDVLNKKTENAEDDKLFSVSQRFTYFQDKPSNTINGGLLPHLFTSKPKPTSRLKPTRMTVRLRPRQVLCSKCRSICNENSENVDHSSNAKNATPFTENKNQNNQVKPTRNLKNLRPTLIPKLNRLQPNEISNAINGKVVTRSNTKCNVVTRSSDEWLDPATPTSPANVEPAPLVEEARMSPAEEADKDEDYLREEEDGEGKMVLRKKRSVGSMEDLWDENVFVEATKKARTTPVIKISFGTQGEGTVLKIPSKVQNLSESEPEEKHKTASAKAAKKALKKAKKEARRKFSQAVSPGSSPAYEALHYRRHRHKVKHKKKHKEDRSKDPAVYTDMKERCLKQKLSISLRRLNANAYAHRSDSGSSESGSSSSSSEEAVPDFPPLQSPLSSPHHPLQSPLSSSNPSADIDPGPNTFAVGDIVWGKIHGFPWWPGKVTKICTRRDGEPAQAHVSWYGSSTSSLMSCQHLSPFLETFKVRFNKKKKSGPYKEAIKQATSEASDIPQKILHSPLRSLMSSPAHVHVTS
ncbi:PWWP domain-containing protein 2A-like [Macrosteles quadrilineatus]|uniref:PWWP domain-containing protein 2A-like n=1 Tax=Macrosteles quadrilineatus TaxID=74068 RepID=UPI0023E1AEB6|nr:PWWP domain-containing protein 2A-like [Macrosteles quadrilineatus]